MWQLKAVIAFGGFIVLVAWFLGLLSSEQATAYLLFMISVMMSNQAKQEYALALKKKRK